MIDPGKVIAAAGAVFRSAGHILVMSDVLRPYSQEMKGPLHDALLIERAR